MAIGRPPNKDRILLLLSASEGLSKSSLRVKTELNLSDDSYEKRRPDEREGSNARGRFTEMLTFQPFTDKAGLQAPFIL